MEGVSLWAVGRLKLQVFHNRGVCGRVGPALQ